MRHFLLPILLPTVFSCFFFAILNLYAAESYQPATNWKANWITAENLPDPISENLWLAFRKDFSLEKVTNNAPIRLLCRIACDSKYWLYVNGQLVVFEGQLKRGPTPNDTYFDVVDLSKHLKQGKNQIAVLMWYFGKDGFSHKSSGMPGFLFDASANNYNSVELLSNSDWKATIYTAYEQKTKDPQPNYRLPESNIRFDARKDFSNNWTSADFDDSGWKPAKVLSKNTISPWNNLYERPIPLWKDYGITDYVNKQEFPAVSDGKPIVCKLPYNAQITPVLKIDAPEGCEIDIRTDNYQGGGEYNVRAEYVTKQGVQEYESFGWMNGHVVIYTIPAGIKILSLQYRETGYDTEIAGSFECDDPFFNELWKKSARTLYVTMRDTYFDCPDRERAQWWGDAVNELGEAFYALDSKSAMLPYKGMYELMRWQRDDGAIYSPVPAGNWTKELPMQMLASVGPYGMGLWAQTTGNFQPLRDLSPQIIRYLQLFQFGDDGLVLHRKGAWDWGDWGENIDLRVLTNCWYYMALSNIIDVSDKVQFSNNEVEVATEIKQKIKDHFDKIFWNGNEYRDPQYKGQTDDRANAMAVISGLADKEKYPAIREVLLKQKHASPYMEKYVLEALFKMNYENDAFARMKERFQKMVEHPDYTTLWEGWGIGKEGFGGGTTNHAWSGGGLTLLSQYAAGITNRHNQEFTICPQPGPLKRIKSKTPTPHGDLLVEIERKDQKMKIAIVLPKNTKGILKLPKQKIKPKLTIYKVNFQPEMSEDNDYYIYLLQSKTLQSVTLSFEMEEQ
ncbi:MAG: hypothetical protein LBK82_11870 [Planctomycetaceae bacterium]|jgi:hypothetical protein|nr:hypothetical protein [Planctomycetaceae bacterium]